MIVKRVANGELYVYGLRSHCHKNFFTVKWAMANNKPATYISMFGGLLYCPKDLIGKRVRLKVEVIE
jgi:hypothetical protein